MPRHDFAAFMATWLLVVSAGWLMMTAVVEMNARDDRWRNVVGLVSALLAIGIFAALRWW
jgi:hypothetical protein